jgi:hypothetical protein
LRLCPRLRVPQRAIDRLWGQAIFARSSFGVDVRWPTLRGERCIVDYCGRSRRSLDYFPLFFGKAGGQSFAASVTTSSGAV